MISSAQVDAYQRNGYVVLEGILSEAQIAEIEADIDAFLAPGAEGRRQSDLLEIEKDRDGRETGTFRRINHPHVILESVRRLSRCRLIVDLLSPILGPDIRLHNSKINLKLPGGAPVEWHQDWAFYPHTNDDFVTVGILLDDTTEANGGMLCIPGSHRGPLYDHHNSETGNFCHAIELEHSPVDVTAAEGCFGRRGSVTLHHVRTLHGSGPNKSLTPRRFLLIGYTAADAWPLLGVTSFEDYENALIAGKSTLRPRMIPLPVTVPFPVSTFGSQIFESQRELRNTHFPET